MSTVAVEGMPTVLGPERLASAAAHPGRSRARGQVLSRAEAQMTSWVKFSDPWRSWCLGRTLLSLSLVLEACVHVSVHESVRYFSDLVPWV